MSARVIVHCEPELLHIVLALRVPRGFACCWTAGNSSPTRTQLQGNGDLGEQITTKENQELKRSLSTVATSIRSIFGVHHFEQFTYSAGKGKAIALRPTSPRRGALVALSISEFSGVPLANWP